MSIYKMEAWKPVLGWEGLYEVSDAGRVRSLHRPTPAVLKPTTMKSGHHQVMLCRDGLRSGRLVHSLVLEAFVCRRPPGKQSLHRNGRPACNTLDNLRWGTRRENIEDARVHGSFPVGSARSQARLTEACVPIIRSLLADAHTDAAVAAQFGVTRGTIRSLRIGKTWSHA